VGRSRGTERHPTKGRRRCRGAGLALLAVLAVGCAAGGPADVQRDPSGRPTQAGTVRADKLRDGDCFDDQTDQTPEGFPVLPCTRPHDNEAFFRFVVPGDVFPGVDALTDVATDRCRGDAFTDYVGRPIAGSDLEVFFVVPSKETWEADGDRVVVCATFVQAIEPLTASVKGSMR
jgi:hypothetical protein